MDKRKTVMCECGGWIVYDSEGDFILSENHKKGCKRLKK